MPIRKREPEPTPEEPAEDMDIAEPEPQIEAAPELEVPQESDIPEPEAETQPEIHSHGEELPVEHVEHKKCPGCGIFVDLDEKICPVCDTEFGVESISVPSIEEEMEQLTSEPTIDDITVPDASAPHMECPSCGADLEAGTKICPVCEYPLV